MHELALCRLSTKTGEVAGHVRMLDGDLLVLDVESLPEDREIGDAAEVTVLDPVRGHCHYTGLLGALDGDEVTVVVLERGAHLQRRSAARAYYRVSCLGKLETVDGTEPLPVTVVDVSASGVRFVTRRLLEHGDVVRFPMPAGDDSVDLVARVLRVEEGQHEWRYGCELLELHERTRERLFKLVLGLHRAAARERTALV